jgi:hypothetical protein
MYLRCYTRKKNGKRHRYWSVVESRRLAGGKTAQRQVLYLGEINDSQEAAWRKTLKVFDPEKRRTCQLSLFPSDRPIPPDAPSAVSVDLTAMRLRRPRRFGDCRLGLMLWRELGLEGFWGRALGRDRGAVDWPKDMDRQAPTLWAWYMQLVQVEEAFRRPSRRCSWRNWACRFRPSLRRASGPGN